MNKAVQVETGLEHNYTMSHKNCAFLFLSELLSTFHEF